MVSARQLGYAKGEAKVLFGVYAEKMAQHARHGRTVWDTADVVQARIGHPYPKHPVWTNYFDTRRGLAATPEAIYLDLARLQSVTPATPLTHGGILVQDTTGLRAYDRKELNEFLNKSLSEKEFGAVPTRNIWLGLVARPEDTGTQTEDRLDRYTELVFKFGKDVYSLDKLLGLYVPQDDRPIVREVILSRLGDGADAGGRWHLDVDGALLVGVRPGESGEAAAKISSGNLEATVRDLMGRHCVTEAELEQAFKLYAQARETLK